MKNDAAPNQNTTCICIIFCSVIDGSFFALRRSTEISLVIRQTMEACILTHLMPRSQVLFQHLGNISYVNMYCLVLFLKPCLFILQIDIFVQVLQADGGKLRLNWIHVQLLLLTGCQLIFILINEFMLLSVFLHFVCVLWVRVHLSSVHSICTEGLIIYVWTIKTSREFTGCQKSVPALKFSFLQTLFEWLKAANLVSSTSMTDMLDTCSFSA